MSEKSDWICSKHGRLDVADVVVYDTAADAKKHAVCLLCAKELSAVTA